MCVAWTHTLMNPELALVWQLVMQDGFRNGGIEFL